MQLPHIVRQQITVPYGLVDIFASRANVESWRNCTWGILKDGSRNSEFDTARGFALPDLKEIDLEKALLFEYPHVV